MDRASYCARLRIKNIAVEKFLEKAQKKHGKIIDYNNFIWVGRHQKGTFTCKIHGNFEQLIGDHIGSTFPCPDCRELERQKKLQEKYDKLTPIKIKKFNEIHDNFYSYEKYKYKGRKETSTITCPIHGDFEQYSFNHENGSGCPSCTSIKVHKGQSKTQKKFIQEVSSIHPTLDFSNFIYTTNKTKSKVYCSKQSLVGNYT